MTRVNFLSDYRINKLVENKEVGIYRLLRLVVLVQFLKLLTF